MCHRINLPKRKRRDRLKELERASPRESYVEVDVETASEASSEQDYSYEFAQMEVIMKTLGNNGTVTPQHCVHPCSKAKDTLRWIHVNIIALYIINISLVAI